jgi:hypothetical protein
MTQQPHFKQKLQPEKSYGHISYSGAKPRGLYVPSSLSLKEKRDYREMNKKIAYKF